MAKFKQDSEITPVLFRVHRSPTKFGRDVTAVFPCEPADTIGRTMSCYSHIGQHSACSYAWYIQTRPAAPEEYADLFAELEAAPYGYRLKVCRQISNKLRSRFSAE
ncbi:MAG: hypothetical protein ACREB3_17440, partial [Burkholderiales bacterium]